MVTSGEATSIPYKKNIFKLLFWEAKDSSANWKIWYPFKTNKRSGERNIFQTTVSFCPDLESAQILGPGIWNHKNYHHRNNCFKIGSIALILSFYKKPESSHRVQYTVWDWRKAKCGRNHRIGGTFCAQQNCEGLWFPGSGFPSMSALCGSASATPWVIEVCKHVPVTYSQKQNHTY